MVAAVVTFIFSAIYAHWSSLVLHDRLLHVVTLHLVPSIWINAGMLFHLFRAVRTPAHSPPKCSNTPAPTSVPGRWCAVCSRVRDARTQHCRTCNRCCTDMDHHCPFTANCVGWYARIELRLAYTFAVHAVSARNLV